MFDRVPPEHHSEMPEAGILIYIPLSKKKRCQRERGGRTEEY